MRKIFSIVVCLAILLLISSFVLGDIVTLKNGEVIQGTIIKENSKKLIIYHPHYGNRIIDKADIESVERELKEVPKEGNEKENSGEKITTPSGLKGLEMKS